MDIIASLRRLLSAFVPAMAVSAAIAAEAPTTKTDCDALVAKVDREIRPNVDVYYPLGRALMEASCNRGDFAKVSTIAREIYRRRSVMNTGRNFGGLPDSYPDSVPRPATQQDCRRIWASVEPGASAFLSAEGLANFELSAPGDGILALCDAQDFHAAHERMIGLLRDTVQRSRYRP